MCDLFTMIIMSRSNYLLFVNDCPKYRSCFACNYVLVNKDYILYALWGLALKSFVYNNTVDYDLVLVSTIVPIKMTV